MNDSVTGLFCYLTTTLFGSVFFFSSYSAVWGDRFIGRKERFAGTSPKATMRKRAQGASVRAGACILFLKTVLSVLFCISSSAAGLLTAQPIASLALCMALLHPLYRRGLALCMSLLHLL